MVQYKDGNIYLKIVYYGMGGSGKTTIFETLYQLTKGGKRDDKPSILKKGETVEKLAKLIHKDFIKKFKITLLKNA